MYGIQETNAADEVTAQLGTLRHYAKIIETDWFPPAETSCFSIQTQNVDLTVSHHWECRKDEILASENSLVYEPRFQGRK